MRNSIVPHLRIPSTHRSVIGGAYANSLALNAVGVGTDGGSWQQGRGSFNRMFREMPAPSDEQLEQNLYRFSADLAAVGLTTVYDVDRPSAGDISLIARGGPRRKSPFRYACFIP